MSNVEKLLERIVDQQDEIIRLLGGKDGTAQKDAQKQAQKKPSAKQPLAEQVRMRRLKLYRAALNGDWEVAKRIYDNCEENIGVEISKKGETALHIAAAAKRIDFVKELVKRMNENDLSKQNNVGSTALFFAAASGKVELAQEIMKNNKAIATIPDNSGTLPIDMAAWLGDKRMVEYLYQETTPLNEENRKQLFISCIETDLYDIALQLLTNYPNLATARAANKETALHVLARKSLKFSNSTNQNRRGIFKRWFNLGTKVVENKKQQALELVERIWQKVVLLSDHEFVGLTHSYWRIVQRVIFGIS